MKTIIKIAGLACLAVGTIACKSNSSNAKLDNLVDSASYILGSSVAGMLQQQGFDTLNTDAFAAGLRAFNIDEDNLPLGCESEELQNIMIRYQDLLQSARNERLKNENNETIVEGEKFLAENKLREGVITTESGLQYKIITEGKGEKITPNHIAKVSYKGSLINGTEFDKGDSVDFPVMQVIPGFSEALQLFNVGTKAKIYIPYELGYGVQGAIGVIPPCATLIFDVEVVGVSAADMQRVDFEEFREVK